MDNTETYTGAFLQRTRLYTERKQIYQLQGPLCNSILATVYLC